MTEPSPIPFEPVAFRDALVSAGFLLPTPVQGAYGFDRRLDDLVEGFDALVLRTAAADGAETLAFPPIVARSMIERLGYLENFPQLIGSLHGFRGDEAAARELASRARGEAGPEAASWESMLSPTGTMLLPAACYPIYPVFSGVLGDDAGRLVTTRNWCFRHEPSDEPTRLQSFRMREYVRVGAPDVVEAWRDGWRDRALALLRGLGLPAETDVANDPFFGRAGRMRANSQREQRLKFEILVPVISREAPTAICSFNWHQEHFSSVFGIRRPGGETAHTACLGFGLERCAMALLRTHGLDLDAWPAPVRAALWP